MNGIVTLINLWVQKLISIKMLRKILSVYRLFDLRIVAYLVLLIYWSIILLGTFVLSN